MSLNWLTNHTRLWNWLALTALAISFGMIFIYAPTERTMGYVQRIFYFHVGSAWVASITFFVALVCGVMYLRWPDKRLDGIAVASVEIGVAFMMMTIVSGSIWGKPAWNTYWIWSPRLTSITIMWLVYVSYFLLRGALDNAEQRRRFSAVYLIVAFATVIVTYGSIRILRDIHPVMFGGAMESAQGAEQGLQEFNGLDSIRMVITLNSTIVTFTVLYLAWMANRLRLEQTRHRLEGIKARVLARL